MKTAVQSLKDIDADVILMATGRKPRTEGLNFEALGITLARNGAIPVDDNFRVATVPAGYPAGLYAIGDGAGITRGLMQASATGIAVARHIAGKLDQN